MQVNRSLFLLYPILQQSTLGLAATAGVTVGKATCCNDQSMCIPATVSDAKSRDFLETISLMPESEVAVMLGVSSKCNGKSSK